MTWIRTGRDRQLSLVLGATGKTGRRVASRLEARGLAVRRGSRSASPSFDWTRPEGWGAALHEVATGAFAKEVA